jgi:hypothetical protein
VLLKYVREVQPALVEQFVENGPPAVVAAMKNTITNMLGTLPPQFFTVTISTVGENMSQLMLSVMMTGYLFRNAQYRLELRNALGGASIRTAASASTATVQQISVQQRSQSAPEQGSVLDEEAYAPGVQKSRVQVRGHVGGMEPARIGQRACRCCLHNAGSSMATRCMPDEADSEHIRVDRRILHVVRRSTTVGCCALGAAVSACVELSNSFAVCTHLGAFIQLLEQVTGVC